MYQIHVCTLRYIVKLPHRSEAMADLFAIPEVAKYIPSGLGPVLKSVPVAKRTNVYMHPWHFDLSEHAKYGQTGKFPSMYQIKLHLPSIVFRNYQPEKEALEVKFDLAVGEELRFFQTKFIDGHTKSIMVQSILAMCIYMEPWLKVKKTNEFQFKM